MKIHNPPMRFKSPEVAKLWEEWLGNQKSAYGKAVFCYASEWATRMEALLDNQESVKNIAEKTSREADTEGITGFMYGQAVCLLARCWLYGEELRRWHNLETQLGNEGEIANENGGVLNPAVLNVRI